MAYGFDKFAVAGFSLTIVTALLAYVGAHFLTWLAYCIGCIACVFCCSTLFYLFHCKPLIAAKRDSNRKMTNHRVAR